MTINDHGNQEFVYVVFYFDIPSFFDLACFVCVCVVCKCLVLYLAQIIILDESPKYSCPFF